MEALLKTFDLTLVDGYMIPVVSVLFVFLWRSLSKELFFPYLALIEAREQATLGAEKEAQEAQDRARNSREEYERKLGEARRAAIEQKLSLVHQARLEADRIRKKAEEEAQSYLLAVRKEIAREVEEAKKNAPRLAQELVADLLERVASSTVLSPPICSANRPLRGP